MTSETTARCAVLLSGGVDSAVVLAALGDGLWMLKAVWIDYGQAPAEAERAASRQIASYYGVPWEQVIGPNIRPAGGTEIPHRNDLLVAVAAAANPGWSLGLGIHAGTGYVDCSTEWLAEWRRLLILQRGDATLVAPLARLVKQEVYSLAVNLGVPVGLTHSCEVDGVPCGQCRSCRDRRGLRVGA